MSSRCAWQALVEVNVADLGGQRTHEELKESLKRKGLCDDHVQAVLPFIKVSTRMWFFLIAPGAFLSRREMLTARASQRPFPARATLCPRNPRHAYVALEGGDMT